MQCVAHAGALELSAVDPALGHHGEHAIDLALGALPVLLLATGPKAAALGEIIGGDGHHVFALGAAWGVNEIGWIGHDYACG
jgi:hypothetical protein